MENSKEMILNKVKPSSIVVTDCWRAYGKIGKYFEHYDVDHSGNYIDPETGANTNTIQRTFNGLRHHHT